VPCSKPVTTAINPGDALLFLGSTLHSPNSNSSAAPFAGVNASYSVKWLTPLENHWLAYSPQVAQGFSPELNGLIGYPQLRPDRSDRSDSSNQTLLPDELPGYSANVVQPPPDFYQAGKISPLPINSDVASEEIIARLQAAYELTRSEAEVGRLLLAGAHARQISRLRAVSIETVRCQIKRVYSKADVNSHSEFLLNNRPLLLPISKAIAR